MQRRDFAALLALAFTGGCAATQAAAQAATQAGVQPRRWPDAAQRLGELEARTGGRLGVLLLDGRSGERAGHRADERFPMCSTFKWLASACLLAQVDTGRESLQRRVRFGREALVPYSPVTEQHVGGPGMSLAELCEATITLSDNTAGNLVLEAIGGPAALTRYARTLGDTLTRLDRIEPGLNEARPGDERDTTTPAAMAANLQRLLLGDALSPGSRRQLVDWMLATQTSGERLRAGLPAGWRLADKTGSGARGSTNDVGVFWPPDGAPVVAAVYLTECEAAAERRNGALAAVARMAWEGA